MAKLTTIQPIIGFIKMLNRWRGLLFLADKIHESYGNGIVELLVAAAELRTVVVSDGY